MKSLLEQPRSSIFGALRQKKGGMVRFKDIFTVDSKKLDCGPGTFCTGFPF